MSNYTHLALGCSHTRAIYLPQESRWQNIVQDNSGDFFEYRYISKIASGLVHLEKRLQTIPLDNAKFVVIQKPQAIRFPWWIENWRDITTQSSYGKLDLVRGRKYSMKMFRQLSNKRQKQIAEYIFNEELQCLIRLRQLFANAKMAYYYYWGDCVLDQLYQPNLASINDRLGQRITDLDVENWGTLIDPYDIPGVYDAKGDIVIDKKKLFQNEWIASEVDQHPGSRFHALIARKVLEWMSH